MNTKSLFRTAALLALLMPAFSAQAALSNWTESFTAGGVDYSLSFQADDTNPTVISSLTGTSTTMLGSTLSLVAPGLFASSNNQFTPGGSIATLGGWDLNGLGFHVSTGGDFNLFDNAGVLTLTDNVLLFTVSNLTFSSTPVTPTPIPAAVWLFGSGIAGLLGLGKKRKTAPAMQAA